jgi:hypothetical protein
MYGWNSLFGLCQPDFGKYLNLNKREGGGWHVESDGKQYLLKKPPEEETSAHLFCHFLQCSTEPPIWALVILLLCFTIKI